MAKIGAGHASAMGRLGWKELRNAANPSKESVADTELGLYGTATQKEVNEDRTGVAAGQGSKSLAELRQYADAKAQEAEKQMGREQGKERARENEQAREIGR